MTRIASSAAEPSTGTVVRRGPGRPRIANGRWKRFTVSFTPEEYLAMNDYATSANCSMAALVRIGISHFLKSSGKLGH